MKVKVRYENYYREQAVRRISRYTFTDMYIDVYMFMIVFVLMHCVLFNNELFEMCCPH